jgi:allene oxide cyclase
MNAKYSSSVPEFSLSRRFQITVATFLIAALGILGGANIAFARETLHVVERELTETTIHLGAKGNPDSVGDMIVFANPIFDSTNTRQLGIVQGTCVRVIVGKSWECFFTLALANDRITLEGPYADTGESVFAITGGTGRYTGAKGQMSLRVRDSKSLPNGAAPVADMIYDIS